MCWEMRGHLWRIYNPSAVQAHTNSEGVMGNRSVGEISAPNGWHWKDYKGWGKNGCYIWQETCNKVGSFWRNRTPPSLSLGPGVWLALRAILCNGHIHTTHSSSSAVYTAPINFQLRQWVTVPWSDKSVW